MTDGGNVSVGPASLSVKIAMFRVNCVLQSIVQYVSQQTQRHAQYFLILLPLIISTPKQVYSSYCGIVYTVYPKDYKLNRKEQSSSSSTAEHHTLPGSLYLQQRCGYHSKDQ